MPCSLDVFFPFIASIYWQYFLEPTGMGVKPRLQSLPTKHVSVALPVSKQQPCKVSFPKLFLDPQVKKCHFLVFFWILTVTSAWRRLMTQMRMLMGILPFWCLWKGQTWSRCTNAAPVTLEGTVPVTALFSRAAPLGLSSPCIAPFAQGSAPGPEPEMCVCDSVRGTACPWPSPLFRVMTAHLSSLFPCAAALSSSATWRLPEFQHNY